MVAVRYKSRVEDTTIQFRLLRRKVVKNEQDQQAAGPEIITTALQANKAGDHPCEQTAVPLLSVLASSGQGEVLLEGTLRAPDAADSHSLAAKELQTTCQDTLMKHSSLPLYPAVTRMSSSRVC